MSAKDDRRITADMTLLDVVHAHPATDPVFRSRDAAAGVCLLCTALFDSIETVAARHHLDLAALLDDLENAVRTAPPA
ncbi:hypothetical protein [Desulfolutivibrio sulfoxidireducens]|uniref:hypothetical protein n=1 Tax=Desulfolutivibrio sulfoxidireducens TaxID=2773299 RepID=UPI00159D5555|nr:hypothetical protein [Desulfolutivibrio sulfoxidireducens]QLA15871.1 hypothetical protein GD605_06795 [Desulfolutivibrio sulfoxidireducens]QLA20227.1 hypothetical protein GD604_11105 [Desulfolutivibrio sulfoxidireducens]